MSILFQVSRQKWPEHVHLTVFSEPNLTQPNVTEPAFECLQNTIKTSKNTIYGHNLLGRTAGNDRCDFEQFFFEKSPPGGPSEQSQD